MGRKKSGCIRPTLERTEKWVYNPFPHIVPMCYLVQGPWGVQCGEESKWLHNPCLFHVNTVGTLQSGYITITFSGSHWCGHSKWSKNPSMLGVSLGRRNETPNTTPTFSGSPWQRQIKVPT